MRAPEWFEFPPGIKGGSHLECPFSLARCGTEGERRGGRLKAVSSKMSIVESGSLFTNYRTHMFKCQSSGF